MARLNSPGLEQAPHTHGRIIAAPAAHGQLPHSQPQYAHPQAQSAPQHPYPQPHQHQQPAATAGYQQPTSNLQWPPQNVDDLAYAPARSHAAASPQQSLSHYVQPQRAAYTNGQYAPPQPPPPSYAPQYDRYTPPAAHYTPPAAQMPAHAQPQAYAAEPLIDPAVRTELAQQTQAAYATPSAVRDAGQDLRSGIYDTLRAAPDPRATDGYRGLDGRAPPQRMPDPAGYDLGSYMPSPGYDQRGTPHTPPQSLDQWSGHDGYHGGAQGQAGVPRAHDEHAGHDDHADYDEAVDEPPKRRRGVLIVAALLGAIGLGGALAYGYKTFLAPPNKNGKPPVVRKEATPTKTKPADPGGRQFANQDSKLLGKLGEDATRPAATSADDTSGVRRVTTLPVGRDGTIAVPTTAPTAASVAPAPPAPAGAPVVPGMILDNGLRNAAAPSPPPAAGPPAQPPAPPVAQPTAPVTPRVATAPPVAQPQPTKAAPAAPAPAAEAPAAAKPAQKVAAKAPRPRDDYAATGGQAAAQTTTAAVTAAAPAAAAATPAAAATASKAGITGYVAVVGSPKSRMEALKTFADLQQKYPNVLGNKTPEVQESDQSARGLGIIYRVMVGPPGSRETANGICQQLKAAGHSGCWVTRL